jgi:hypothetical protein
VGVSVVGMMGENKCVVWGCWTGVVRDLQARRENCNPAPVHYANRGKISGQDLAYLVQLSKVSS